MVRGQRVNQMTIELEIGHCIESPLDPHFVVEIRDGFPIT